MGIGEELVPKAGPRKKHGVLLFLYFRSKTDFGRGDDLPSTEFVVGTLGIKNVAVVKSLGIDREKESRFVFALGHDLDVA